MVKTAGLLGRWMTTANESCERRRLHRSTITPDCHSGIQPSTTHRWIGQRVCKRGVNCIRFTARAASAPLSRVLAGAETLSFGPESWLSSGCRVPSLGALQNRLMQGGSAQRHRKRSTEAYENRPDRTIYLYPNTYSHQEGSSVLGNPQASSGIVRVLKMRDVFHLPKRTVSGVWFPLSGLICFPDEPSSSSCPPLPSLLQSLIRGE
jgi:hypothetical protein